LCPPHHRTENARRKIAPSTDFYYFQIVKYKSVPIPPSEQAIVPGVIVAGYRRPHAAPSPQMRELRMALAVALGVTVASLGTAIVAAAYIAK
jgi:hypothetical protein